MREVTNACVFLDIKDKTVMIRTCANPILATMERRVFKTEIISNVPVGEDTRDSNAEWLTAVCQIRVNMVAPAKPRKEGLFALAQLPTEEHSVMRENHATRTLATTEESVFPPRKDLFAGAQQDIAEKLVQRKMNVNQTLVKMAADVWLIILAAALIVNVLWDSEELPARIKTLASLTRVAMEDFAQK